jgi:hypothetical protein
VHKVLFSLVQPMMRMEMVNLKSVIHDKNCEKTIIIKEYLFHSAHCLVSEFVIIQKLLLNKYIYDKYFVIKIQIQILIFINLEAGDDVIDSQNQ